MLQPTWAILEACIPYGTAEKLARALGKSAETINRYKRPPADDDNVYGTGAQNPIDWLELIQDHAFVHAPGEAHKIHRYFQNRYEDFTASLKPVALTIEQRDREIAEVLREHTDMLQAILAKSTPETVRREWEELKIAGERLVRAIEAGALERMKAEG